MHTRKSSTNVKSAKNSECNTTKRKDQTIETMSVPVMCNLEEEVQTFLRTPSHELKQVVIVMVKIMNKRYDGEIENKYSK